MARRKYVNRSTQRKAMKTSVDDLQEIVKAAVKDAMEENESKEEDPSDDGIDANAADIIEAAIETVNREKAFRKMMQKTS